MENFKQYRRTQIAEMRAVTKEDIEIFCSLDALYSNGVVGFKVSISEADIQNGSPKIGDMIARNPKNHYDQWLVAKQYFQDNFEPI